MGVRERPPAGRLGRIAALIRWHEWSASKLPLFLVALSYAALRRDVPLPTQTAELALLLVLLCLYAAFGHLTNDYGDREVDLAAGKRRPLASWSPASALLLIAGLGGATLLLALPFGLGTLALTAAALAVAAAYSLPPPRLKERAGLAWPTAAVAQRALPMAIVFQALDAWDPAAAALCVAGTAIGIRFIVLHQLRDRSGDRSAGVETAATRRPPRELARLVRRRIFPLEVASVGASVGTMAWLLPSPALLAVAGGYGAARLARRGRKQSSPLSFLLFRDFYGVIWPLLLGCLLTLRDPLYAWVPALVLALQHGRAASLWRRFRPVAPSDRAVRRAMSSGSAALARMQQRDGSFPLLRCAPPEPWAPCSPVFATACILLSAGHLLPSDCVARALDFLRDQRQPDGLWNYDPALGVPADADCTACCLAALALHGPAPDPDGAKLLRSFWRADDGPFCTWRAGGMWAERDRDDPVVNCNVVMALGLLASPATPVEREAVVDLMRRSAAGPRYYAAPATLAHAARRAGLPLDALPAAAAERPASDDLAGAVQWLCGTRTPDPELIASILRAQEPDGGWPVCRWVTGVGRPRPYWGSAAVATALAVEALAATR